MGSRHPFRPTGAPSWWRRSLFCGKFGSCPSRGAHCRNAPFASRSREGGALLTGAKLFDEAFESAARRLERALHLHEPEGEILVVAAGELVDGPTDAVHQLVQRGRGGGEFGG